MEKVKGWKTKVVRDWLQNNKENVTVADVHKELAKKHGDEISLSLVATCFRRLAFFPGAYKMIETKGKNQKIYKRVSGVNIKAVGQSGDRRRIPKHISASSIKKKANPVDTQQLSAQVLGEGILAYVKKIKAENAALKAKLVKQSL
jgi:hypothetical protein